MAEVKIEPWVLHDLNELVEILYREKYFGFLDTAITYAAKIYEFMLPIPQRRYKPLMNKQYGMYYASYKANQHTTWFICFDLKDDLFLISYLTNNHSPDYPLFSKQVES